METLPSLEASAGEQRTGLTCPDCQGAITVTGEGAKGTLRFQCRIGHAYATDEIIAGKEQRVEELLWTVFTALDEVASLLTELVEKDGADAHAETCFERAARAKHQQELIRHAIAENTPTAVGVGIAPDPKTG